MKSPHARRPVASALAVALLLIPLATAAAARAQPVPAADDAEAKYAQVIDKRADGVIKAVGIDDPAAAGRVKAALLAQYRALREVHDARDARIQELKAQHAGDKAAADAAVSAERDSAQAKLDDLNTKFVAQVSTDLAAEQVESLKNAMTYNVLPITARGYDEMLPNLTSEQRATILGLLAEAREKAMTGGSSEEKHGWFGKYKGKINNYLSAQGYDLKQANKDWAARRKAAPPQQEGSAAPATQPGR